MPHGQPPRGVGNHGASVAITETILDFSLRVKHGGAGASPEKSNKAGERPGEQVL